MKPKKEKREKMLARFFHAADVPFFAAGTDESIEIRGRNTVQVEGAQGIHTYEPETVCLQMRGYRLILNGNDFDLVHFGASSFQITGKLKSIEWEN